MSAPEYVVKNELSIVWGPCSHTDARFTALQLNRQYQTDEYRVEEWAA